MKGLLKLYLKPMLDANIDYLVLGCTHYPYLMPLLLEFLPKHIKIIDSGEAVARQTKTVLEQNNILNTSNLKPYNQFYINTSTEVMTSLLENKYNVKYLDF
jgi:glutamate racemase